MRLFFSTTKLFECLSVSVLFQLSPVLSENKMLVTALYFFLVLGKRKCDVNYTPKSNSKEPGSSGSDQSASTTCETLALAKRKTLASRFDFVSITQWAK